MAGLLWFGNLNHSQWVPAPKSGMMRAHDSFTDELAFINGGLWVNSSVDSHDVFTMDFPVADASTYQGIEAFERYDAGEYGAGFLYFVDPMVSDQNLFSRRWAAPGTAELGAKPIYDTIPTFSNTGTNSYQKPYRAATYPITLATGAVPVNGNSVFTLLIPPTQAMWIGASGSATGSGVLRVQPINQDNSLAATVDIALSSDASPPTLTSSFSGMTYKAVRIYITRSSSTASTITLNSLWAQCLNTGVTPNMTRHIPGKGHSGLKFRGTTMPESYVMQQGHQMGGSFVLAEVEPWST